ncbi:uncharacterized protein VTP21DRAFT_6202 [Calcarisporiella thermophila]|uniref:uncharacterized protein n=1 Tax=Calcarisporiella thermophila TaxID=911321 RepID=UPI00374360AA
MATMPSDSATKIDRTKITPFLLRIYCRSGSHHRLEDYDYNRVPASDEFQIYTWKDATLNELLALIKAVFPESNRPNARTSFRLIYQDRINGKHQERDLGILSNSRPSPDDQKTLEALRFVTGDILDVAVFTKTIPPGRAGPAATSAAYLSSTRQPRMQRTERDSWNARDRERELGRGRNGIGNQWRRDREHDRDRVPGREREWDRRRERERYR